MNQGNTAVGNGKLLRFKHRLVRPQVRHCQPPGIWSFSPLAPCPTLGWSIRRWLTLREVLAPQHHICSLGCWTGASSLHSRDSVNTRWEMLWLIQLGLALKGMCIPNTTGKSTGIQALPGRSPTALGHRNQK